VKLASRQDTAEARWILQGLGGSFAAVGRHVPRQYDAYVRICHPVEASDGSVVQWSDVARFTGRQAHSTMQWHALVGSRDKSTVTESLWPGDNPRLGSLCREPLARLCGILLNHTTTPHSCFFSLWDGYGTAPNRPAAELLHHPDRDYAVFAGPLADLSDSELAPSPFDVQSPNLIWPADKAWFVSTEIDFDSTLVGCPEALAEQLLSDHSLETWSIGVDESLAVDADTVNLPNSN